MNVTIPGFQIKEELSSSNRTIIFHAIQEKDITSVIIKTLSPQYSSHKGISSFKHEVHMTRKMDEGVIHAYDQVKYANNLSLILEDNQGVSLNEYLDQVVRVDLEQLLHMAIDICQGLSYIHSQNVIHKEVNPSNIIFNRDTKKAQIIVFGISIELSREKQYVNVTNKLDESFADFFHEQIG